MAKSVLFVLVAVLVVTSSLWDFAQSNAVPSPRDFAQAKVGANTPMESYGFSNEASIPTKPEPFAPRIFSSRDGCFGLHLHSSLYFVPGGDEVFFTDQKIPPEPGRSTTIMVMHRTGSFWSAPVEAPFASEFSDQTGWFSPDGKRFYIGSVRPVSGGRVPEPDLLMWFIDREEIGWSNPKHVSSFSELTVDHGPLYIFSQSEGGFGKNDIYCLRYMSDCYSNLENVGPPVNSPVQEYPAMVGPNDDYLIIYRTDRNNRAITGLYLTFKTENGWTEPKIMGDEIGRGFDASLSSDEKILFFLKRNDGIYYVDAGIIEYLKTNDLAIQEALLRVVRLGSETVSEEFERLRSKHERYYNFDASVLNSVGDKLAEEGGIEDASQVWQTNFKLFPHNRSALRTLAVAAIDGNQQSLDLECKTITKTNSHSTDIDENGINRLGYLLLRSGRHESAIRIFELNIFLFPCSYNVYDSYAEAMMKTGDMEAAAAGYKKSLEINPDNANAVEMLKKLLASQDQS